jgi:hypothetical protein
LTAMSKLQVATANASPAEVYFMMLLAVSSPS